MINRTDSDYREKVQKFIGCIKTIDADKCPKYCGICKFNIEVEDFLYLLAHIDEILPEYESEHA